MNISNHLMKLAQNYSDDIYLNLLERGIDPNRRDVVIDKKSNVATFLIYNLHGQLVGTQKYNPKGSKDVFDPDLMKYYTYAAPDSFRGKKIVVWGLADLNKSQNNVYIVEGIFDAAKIHKTNRNALAMLTGTPSKEMLGFLYLLPFKKIAILDNDEGGSKSKFPKMDCYLTPSPYKDLGEMPLKEADLFLTQIEQNKIRKV